MYCVGHSRMGHWGSQGMPMWVRVGHGGSLFAVHAVGHGCAVGAVHVWGCMGSCWWGALGQPEGTVLGLWLVGREPDADSASLKADSQVAIQVLYTHKPGPSSYLLDEIHK